MSAESRRAFLVPLPASRSEILFCSRACAEADGADMSTGKDLPPGVDVEGTYGRECPLCDQVYAEVAARAVPRTPREAEAAGFMVDRSCYPHVAYKGPRFRPEEHHRILTDTEAELLAALLGLVDVVEGHVASDCDICGGEGSWTDEQPSQMLPVKHRSDCIVPQMYAALARAGGRR